MQPIEFLATIAPITTAIKFDGRAEGGRLTLEIPESDIAALSLMLLLRERVFRVKVEPLDEGRG